MTWGAVESFVLTESPPHPALRATFSRGGEKGGGDCEFRGGGLLPLWEKVAEGRMRGRAVGELA